MLSNVFVVLLLVLEAPVTGVTELGILWFFFILMLKGRRQASSTHTEELCSFSILHAGGQSLARAWS